jgi:hypothetical protein
LVNLYGNAKFLVQCGFYVWGVFLAEIRSPESPGGSIRTTSKDGLLFEPDVV